MSARERPVKRFRRLSTDSEGDSPVDYEMRPAQAERQQLSSQMSPNMSRSRRTGPNPTSEPMATVSRGPASSSSTHRTSLNLTVKLPASKLREATSRKSSNNPRSSTTNSRTVDSVKSNEKVSVNSRDQFVGGEILAGKRSRNVKKSYVLESESDDDDEDAEGEDDDAEMDDAEVESDDEDAEGEDDDADGDIDMDAPPPPPTIKVSKAMGKSIISARPSGRGDGKSVEQKEMAQAGSDDDLSELGSDVEEEEGMQVDNEEDPEGEEDAEGEDEEIEMVKDGDEEGSDEETRESTPNMSMMTKRQRARFEEGGSGHLMALPDEVQVKKHLTAEEHAMRRAEMARRRKNLSEKRNEEEKMETINKLLKKQAPKTNARRANLGKDKDEVALLGENGNGDEGDDELKKADPIFVRWVSNQQGVRLGVPEEWLGKDVGRVFGQPNGVGGVGLGTGRLVEEVE